LLQRKLRSRLVIVVHPMGSLAEMEPDEREVRRSRVKEWTMEAELGNVRQLRFLLNRWKRFDILDDKNVNGDTALACAAGADKVAAVQFLLEQGANPHRRNTMDDTALHQAARRGNIPICRALMEAGAEADQQNNHGRTPLHFAAAAGHAEVLFTLCSKAADVNTADSTGQTPMHLAAKDNKARAAYALLYHDAKIDLEDNEGHTSLVHSLYNYAVQMTFWFHAVTAGKIDQVRLVLASVVGGKEGFKNLSRALFNPEGDDEDLLRKHRELINARHPTTGYSALCMTVVEGHLDLFDYLLSQDADVAVSDEQQDTPLHHAARKRSAKMVQALIDKGAPINALNKGEATPLHAAAACGNSETVEALVRLGAAIEAKDALAYTAVHYAAANGHIEATKVLAKGGADLKVRDKLGKCPHDLASEYKAMLADPRPRRPPQPATAAAA